MEDGIGKGKGEGNRRIKEEGRREGGGKYDVSKGQSDKETTELSNLKRNGEKNIKK